MFCATDRVRTEEYEKNLVMETFKQCMGCITDVLSAAVTTKEFHHKLRELLGPESYVVFSTSWVFNRLLKLVLRIFRSEDGPSAKLLRAGSEARALGEVLSRITLDMYNTEGSGLYRILRSEGFLEMELIRDDVIDTEALEKSRNRFQERLRGGKMYDRSTNLSEIKQWNGLDWTVCEDWRIRFVEGTEDVQWKRRGKRRGNMSTPNAKVAMESLVELARKSL